MLPITIKKKDSHTTRMANQVLSHSLFPDHQSNKPSTTRQVWKLYSKAKDNLQNGSRLENLSWRMMAMTLKKKTASQESTPEKANITVGINIKKKRACLLMSLLNLDSRNCRYRQPLLW